jgi:hypothetical protein
MIALRLLITPSPLEGEVGGVRRAPPSGGSCAKRTNKKPPDVELAAALPAVRTFAAATPHPNPPPQGGRGNVASGCAAGAAS